MAQTLVSQSLVFSPIMSKSHVSQSRCVPVPLCTTTSLLMSQSLVFQSHCVQVPCVPVLLSIVSQSPYVPIPLCTSPLMYQSQQVLLPVPKCPTPSPFMSQFLYVPLPVPKCPTPTVPAPLCPSPLYINCTSPICVHGASRPQKSHGLLSTNSNTIYD